MGGNTRLGVLSEECRAPIHRNIATSRMRGDYSGAAVRIDVFGEPERNHEPGKDTVV